MVARMRAAAPAAAAKQASVLARVQTVTSGWTSGRTDTPLAESHKPRLKNEKTQPAEGPKRQPVATIGIK